MKILYVEDNQANVFLVKRVARMGNHEVINYIDGEEALKKFAEDQPDLVLMDLQLAGDMDGLEAVEKLRAEGFTQPIVAVTAYAMVGDREKCIAAGCDDYLPKPLPVPDLVALFDRFGKSQTLPSRKTLSLKPTDTSETKVITVPHHTHAPKETAQSE